MFNMQKVGRKIVELRKKNNMTQTELADKMNVSFQAVSNWERGNSMPDIAKLPELASIFGVSVDELIGGKSKIIDSAINDEIKEYFEKNEVSKEELEEHIPILKPEQVEDIIKSVNLLKFEDIDMFLPYLDAETITLLAQERIEKGESIASFLPFMEEEMVAKIAQERIEKGESIATFLPFMEEEMIAKIAQESAEKGESIAYFLPFLEEDAIAKMAKQKIEAGESIQTFLPFMNREVLKEIIHKFVK